MDVDVRYFLLLLALCLGTVGCRGTDASIELLESELRWMEDQLFLMDQELSNANAKLHSSQRYNQSLKNELESVRQQPSGGGGPSRPADAAGQAPQSEDDTINDMDLTIPDIDLGPGEDPTNGQNGAGQNGTGEDDAPKIDNSADPQPFNLDELDETTRSGNGIVDRIVLNSRLTGGYDFDGRPGDEGLLLVIEPQDKSGNYVALPGELTISVYDPTKVGEDARIAQWEYTAEESTELLRQTLLGKGFHLQLPWPNELPDQSQLSVRTSYRSEEGRRLKTNRTIQIDTGQIDTGQIDTGGRSIADTNKPFAHDTSSVPSRHRTGISRVSGVPSPPEAPMLFPVGPGHSTGQPSWQPSRSSAVAGQPRRSTPNVSRRQPEWRPYR
jgi:hypothetical protein